MARKEAPTFSMGFRRQRRRELAALVVLTLIMGLVTGVATIIGGERWFGDFDEVETVVVDTGTRQQTRSARQGGGTYNVRYVVLEFEHNGTTLTKNVDSTKMFKGDQQTFWYQAENDYLIVDNPSRLALLAGVGLALGWLITLTGLVRIVHQRITTRQTLRFNPLSRPADAIVQIQGRHIVHLRGAGSKKGYRTTISTYVGTSDQYNGPFTPRSYLLLRGTAAHAAAPINPLGLRLDVVMVKPGATRGMAYVRLASQDPWWIVSIKPVRSIPARARLN